MTEFLTTLAANLLSGLMLLLVARAWWLRRQAHQEDLVVKPYRPPEANPPRRRTMWG